MLNGLTNTALSVRGPLLVALILGLFFALGMPPYSAPDEAAHLAYVAAFAQGHLPVIPNGAQFDVATGTTWQGQHPPLYYALCTPLYWLCGQHPLPALYVLRCFNILIFLLVVLLVAHLARRLNESWISPDASDDGADTRSRYFASAAPWIVAAHPTIAYIASGVNNEILAVLLGLAGVWASVELVAATAEKARFWWWLAALFCGLAMLTKLTAIAAVAAAATIVLQRPHPVGRVNWQRALALVALAIVFWLPWAGVMKAAHGAWVPSPIVRPLLAKWDEILIFPGGALRVLGLGMGGYAAGLVMPYWLLAPFEWGAYIALIGGGAITIWAFAQLWSAHFRFAGIAFLVLYMLLMAQVFFRDFQTMLFLARYCAPATVLLAFPAAAWWAARPSPWRRAGASLGVLWSLSAAIYIAFFFWKGVQTETQYQWESYLTTAPQPNTEKGN